MAVATVTATINNYPQGDDNTQRRQKKFGTLSFIGSSPSYVQGGLRINFASLETIKAQTLLPSRMVAYSVAGSGYIYTVNTLGAAITNIALTSNVLTITAHNNLAAGDVVLISGCQANTFLNGQKLTVISTGLSATQFEANFTHGNVSSGADSGFALPTSYASGLPFQGNLMIFQSAGTVTPPNPLAEISTAALPTTIVGSTTANADVIAFEADFIREL